jgi:hypothetical protein
MIAILVLALALAAALGAGWGPGHHLEFAERVHRRRRELLPRDVAQLIHEQRDAYDYGNIAADIINFKAYGGSYSHCHRWSIIEDMRGLAESSRQEAFVYGYLSHLAADTIAHNHFVPYHLARYARTKGLGHLYWELNADRMVPVERWTRISELKRLDALDELDELVNRTVPRKALSMGTNKAIFNHVLLVSERDRWRHAMERIHPRRNVSLERGFLRMFQEAAVDRVRLALRPSGFRAIQCVDANGKDAQKRAMRLRTKLVHRLIPGRLRAEAGADLAAPFLKGMQSPPPEA